MRPPVRSEEVRLRNIPEQELSLEQLEGVSAAGTSIVSNLANMRHEMLKAVANNLRG